MDLFRGHRILVLDGAMGTELERRGVPTPLPSWSALANATHSDVVLDVHREYVSAGADIVTANTFRTNRRAMRNAGREDDARGLTRLAVSLAKNAAKERSGVMVAGSIAPVEDCWRPDLVPDDGALIAEHEELSTWLIEDGVDILLIETMNTLREAKAALAAARGVTDRPVFVSVACGPEARLLDGTPVADAVARIQDGGADAFMVNCSSIADVTEAITAAAAVSRIPIGGYANTGAPEPGREWDTVAMTPGTYASAVRLWMRAGARIVGGCCGTQPEHIAAVRAAVEEEKMTAQPSLGE